MADPDAEDFGRSPLLPFALLLLSLALLGYLATWPAPALDLGVAAVLALLAAVAEQLTPFTGRFGFFPLALPAYLGPALLPAVGPRPVAAYAVLALTLRALRRGTVPAQRWMEVVSDLFPLSVALVSTSAGVRWLPPLAYLATWIMQTGLFSASLGQAVLREWTLTREKGLALVAFTSLATTLCTSLEAVAILAVCSWLLRTPYAAMKSVYRAEAEERSRREEDLRLTQTQKSVSQRQKQQELSGQELALQTQVMGLLGELLAGMSRHLQPGESSRRLLSAIKNLVPCRTLALYVQAGARLDLATCHSPVARDIPTHVETAENLVEGEQSLAIPISDWGVLYVGDTHPTWEDRHLELLERLAPHLRLYIDSTRYYELQASALETETALRRQLESLLRGLTKVLDTLGSLLKIREPEWLIQTAYAIVPELVPQEGIAVRYGETVRCSREGLEPMLSVEPGLHRLPRALGGLPAGSECLVLPLKLAEEPGALAIFAGSQGTLSREDVDLLKIFGMELSSLLDNARLYSQLHGALAQLKESQAQLIQSSKLAAIGQLAAGVAHELNTPLGAIAVAIDGAIMALEGKPERAKARLEKAILSVEQMQQIIAKLLFYSRDSRAGRTLSDINPIIEDSLQLVGHQLKLDNITIDLQLNPVPPVNLNANEMKQVFTNLLLNAKDAMLSPGARGRQLVIHSSLVGDMVLVRLRDQGCGMPEEVRARIFEPFFSTKPVGHGTGLGLPTSLQLVQQHGGELLVDSAPGEGTTFTVALPKAEI